MFCCILMLFFRPLETPEQNVRRLSAKPDIVLPHSNCFETDLLNITSCNQCGILYCSEDCKENSYSIYHRSLCYIQNETQHPINVLIETWKYVKDLYYKKKNNCSFYILFA